MADKELKSLSFQGLDARYIVTIKTTSTDAKYFDITDDGVLSLKPEYRGACPTDKAGYEYGLSDNGVGADGSKNSELPEEIIIPEVVNEMAVTSLAYAMFIGNCRIKRLVLPSFIREIPGHCCYGAFSLAEVSGTENVETLNKYAFANSGISKASFSSLKALNGTNHFKGCGNLVVADLGSAITEIPAQCFAACGKLTHLRKAENVTAIGAQGFLFTQRLKTLPFLPNLADIGDHGLLLSRVNYDWDSLTDCTFGTLSTAKEVNDTDYSGCTFEACGTPMRSTFEQHNPLWADKQIGNIDRTYTDGCMYVAAAMVYSALAEVDMESPEQFVEAVGAANADLLNEDIADEVDYLEGLQAWLEAVGLTVDRRTAYTAENVQAMYDALANGALVISQVCAGPSGGYHMAVFHGINAGGELLVTDPATQATTIGVYEAATYSMPVQNMARPDDCFVIVSKKEE